MKITPLKKSSSNISSSFKQFKNVLDMMVKNHNSATKMVEESLKVNNFTPEHLIKVQFQTGLFFLKEQTFCKTAEQSANAIKNFTQMPI